MAKESCRFLKEDGRRRSMVATKDGQSGPVKLVSTGRLTSGFSARGSCKGGTGTAQQYLTAATNPA